MFICVVRVVGGSTRKGQSRVERGNIFPTFTRQQQAGPGLVTRQRGKLCGGSAKDVCHITWPRDVPPVATPTTINMHRRVETGVQITSHYILHYILNSAGQMADNRNICQHPGPDLASGWVLPMVTNWGTGSSLDVNIYWTPLISDSPESQV